MPDSDKLDLEKNYSAPDIISENTTKVNLLYSKYDKIDIEFGDGIKGSIYCKPDRNKYYFKNNEMTHYYNNYTDCINALHYFLTKGLISKNGFVDTYS